LELSPSFHHQLCNFSPLYKEAIKYAEDAVNAQRAKTGITVLDEIGSDVDDVIRDEADYMTTSMTETNEEKVDTLKAELVLCG